MKILSQKISFDETGQWLITKYEDGTVSSKPITAEEAAEWQTENGF